MRWIDPTGSPNPGPAADGSPGTPGVSQPSPIIGDSGQGGPNQAGNAPWLFVRDWLGKLVDVTPQAPNWAGPAVVDLNAPPALLQALSDISGGTSDQNISGEFTGLYGRDPLGGLLDLNPQAPNWAGPAPIDPNAPPPLLQALSDTSGGTSDQNITGEYTGLYGRDPLGGLVDLNPQAPNWAGPAPIDPNAPPPVLQALSDISGGPSDQNITGDYQGLYGRDPLGGLVDLNPQAPNWAGPDVIDPNAPPQVMQALGADAGNTAGESTAIFGPGLGGGWQNLTPEAPVVAGPAIIDPNAPPPVLQALPAQHFIPGSAPEPPPPPSSNGGQYYRFNWKLPGIFRNGPIDVKLSGAQSNRS